VTGASAIAGPTTISACVKGFLAGRFFCRGESWALGADAFAFGPGRRRSYTALDEILTRARPLHVGVRLAHVAIRLPGETSGAQPLASRATPADERAQASRGAVHLSPRIIDIFLPKTRDGLRIEGFATGERRRSD